MRTKDEFGTVKKQIMEVKMMHKMQKKEALGKGDYEAENLTSHIDQFDVEEIVTRFKRWLNSGLGIKKKKIISDEKQEVKELMERLSQMDKKSPEFTDIVLYGLLPNYKTKFAKRVSTFPTFMNIRTFFKNYNYSDEDWNVIANMVFTLAKRFQQEPEKLKTWIEEFVSDDIHSRRLQCGSITPILSCINDSFPVINSNIVRTYNVFSYNLGWDDRMSQKLVDYMDIIPKCNRLIDLLDMDKMDYDVFGLFCWWYDNGIENDENETDFDEDDENETDDEATSKKLEVDLKEFINSLNIEKLPDLEHYRLRSPDRIRIRELLSFCKKCEWQLPNFQRYFDWKKLNIRDLLDSVFRDFYIGSLLLWEAQSDPQLKLIPILGAEQNNDVQTRMIILDGQQRITSLYYAIKGSKLETKSIKNHVYFYIDFERYLRGDENNIIMRERKLGWEESLKSLCFPFYELENYDKWVRALSDMARDGENYHKVSKMERLLAEKLKHLIDGFEIPYIVLPSSIDLPQVADIFEKINTKGKSLSVFDILIATLSKYGIDLRHLWDNVVKKYPRFKEYNGEDKMPIYILQSIALYHHDLSLCGRDDLLKIYDNVIEPKDLIFDDVWDEMAEWTHRSISKLENHNDGFGVKDRKTLPYLPVIPILAALLRKVDERTDKGACYSKISMWYWSSIFAKMYSSAVDSRLTADYREMVGWKDESGNPIPGWFDDDSKVLKSIEGFRRGFLGTINLKDVKAGAIFKGIMSLIALEGAPDFDTGQHSTNDNNDRHHIFPKQRFGKRSGSINSVLNMTYLSGSTNRKIINDKEPSVYVRQLLKKNQKNDRKKFQKNIMDGHLISKDAFECMLNDDLDGFMNARANTISDKIAQVVGLQNNKTQSSVLIEPKTPFSNESAMMETIRECREYIYWFDKYFSRKGLEWLKDLPDGQVSSIRILAARSRPTLAHTESLRNSFKKFKTEMKLKGINSELRILADSKVEKNIHDRWLITKNTAYGVPSTDTIQRGQTSLIVRDVQRPSFEDWWDHSLDIIEDWNRIIKL